MRSNEGFSLIEALVAVALMGIVIAVGVQVNRNTLQGMQLSEQTTGKAQLALKVASYLNNRSALNEMFGASENAGFVKHRNLAVTNSSVSSGPERMLIKSESGQIVIDIAGSYYSAKFEKLPSIAKAKYFVAVTWQGLKFNSATVLIKVVPAALGAIDTTSPGEQVIFFPPSRQSCIRQVGLLPGSAFNSWSGTTVTCPVNYSATHVSAKPGVGVVTSRVALDPNNERKGSCFQLTPNAGQCILNCCQFD